MSELEDRLNTLLSNPQLMQQIATMAQSMGAEPQSKPPEQSEPSAAPVSGIDPKLLQSMAQVFGKTGVDGNQKALLHALSPYLSQYRIHKLQRAMEAARLAAAASGFLNAGGLKMLTGR